MTDLSKKVSRRLNLPLDNRPVMRDKDRITVTLYPDGYIGFRAHKCRHEYQLPLVAAYKMAINAEAMEAKKVKEQDRRLKRGGSIKVRRSVI